MAPRAGGVGYLGRADRRAFWETARCSLRATRSPSMYVWLGADVEVGRTPEPRGSCVLPVSFGGRTSDPCPPSPATASVMGRAVAGHDGNPNIPRKNEATMSFVPCWIMRR